MLEMRERCERCEVALDAAGDAIICSYECTFCPECSAEMDGVCPNCFGGLVYPPPEVMNQVRSEAGGHTTYIPFRTSVDVFTMWS
jgi:hypothetical protein